MCKKREIFLVPGCLTHSFAILLKMFFILMWKTFRINYRIYHLKRLWANENLAWDIFSPNHTHIKFSCECWAAERIKHSPKIAPANTKIEESEGIWVLRLFPVRLEEWATGCWFNCAKCRGPWAPLMELCVCGAAARAGRLWGDITKHGPRFL